MMRKLGWIAAVGVGCGGAPTGPAATASTVSDTPPSNPTSTNASPSGEAAWVGVLSWNTENSYSHPSSYCLDDGHLWQGAPFRVGRINAFGRGLRAEASWHDKVVVLRGVQRPSLMGILQKGELCPENMAEGIAAQIAVEEICDEGWPLTTFEKMKQTPYVGATDVREVDFLVATRRGDTVSLTIKNPFPQKLTDLSLKLDYDRAGAKGPSITDSRSVSLDANGETTIANIPYSRAATGGRRDLAYVSVRGEASGVHIDVRSKLAGLLR